MYMLPSEHLVQRLQHSVKAQLSSCLQSTLSPVIQTSAGLLLPRPFVRVKTADWFLHDDTVRILTNTVNEALSW